MILIHSEVISILLITVFVVIVMAVAWVGFWYLLDLYIGTKHVGPVAAVGLLVVAAAAVAWFCWTNEARNDRLGLVPSMRSFIVAYREDSISAVERYSLRTNELSSVLWRQFMSEFEDGATVKDIDLLTCTNPREDIRDITHIYAVQYTHGGEKRFMLFARHDKSGGLFVPPSRLHERFVEEEIASYEHAGWKHVR